MSRLFSYLSAVSAAIMLTACSQQQGGQTGDTSTTADSLTNVLENDSTVYGLACDGCTDTILVFLPLTDVSSDPDTFNILNASRNHKVFGRLKVGDKVAIVPNATNRKEADFVINLQGLYGTWCYQVTPTLRQRVGMNSQTQTKMLNNLPDSIREQIMAPREYGMQINGDYTMRSMGQHSSTQEEANSPVEYPKAKRYRQWHLYNGLLLFTAMGMDSLGNAYPIGTDTAELVLMRRDSLVLRFKNEQPKGYYRKHTDE